MFNGNLNQEILSEIQKLREQVQHLGSKLVERSTPLKDRASRQPLQSEIEMIGDFDILEAEGVDISDTGICFELRNHLFFDMRFMHGDTLTEKRAQLVWVKQADDGRTRLGFHFVDAVPVGDVVRRIEE
jgi:hypothetical protein